ncbi:hypothetical protein M426DRAFT_319816 [Hypoxylon sp. CI-4A]|nr:hypothetical protein M426DRAFT_319816 [Hypoxylon sp. CI-4A]
MESLPTQPSDVEPNSVETNGVETNGDESNIVEPSDDTATPPPQIPDIRPHAEELREEPPVIPNTDPPANTRRCFICLVDEPEATLPTDWSTPCKCALEGHYECLMTWVTDLEARDKEIKCPMCKSPITVTERWDFTIQLNNYLQNTLSSWSPRIIFGFIASGVLVSSSIYGAKAIDWFAGPEATMNFLLDSGDVTILEVMRQQNQGNIRNRNPSPVNFLHFAVLPLIAPGLILNRLRLGEVVLIPVSLLYTSLIDQTEESATWPPTPQRALALYPALKATYFHIHNVVSANLQRRWEAQAKKLAYSIIPEQSQPRAAPDPAPEPEPGNDLLGFDMGDIRRELHEDENRNEGARDNNRRNNRTLDSTKSIANFIAGALVWPGVCYGMGELLRLVMPSRFVTRPSSGANTGILQERWGRSLVGGSIFVVLKDVFYLWVQYRKTMNRSSRRIKNAENRRIRR